MASHDSDVAGLAPAPAAQKNPHASTSRWRHQESSAYARHAAKARDPQAHQNTNDLADFLNSSRVEPQGDGQHGGHFKPITVAGHVDQAAVLPEHTGHDGREIVCGPLLNYRRMDAGRWYGSVLVVVKGGGVDPLFQPALNLRRATGSATEAAIDDGTDRAANVESAEETRFESDRLYSDARNTFWAFDIDVPIEPAEVQWEYSVPDMRFSSDKKPQVSRFFVPAAAESMRIMFHSCNGFSVGTDEDAWSGPALWNDVIRKHQERPFHVMLGGGDQIYNDGIRVNGPLRAWANIGNPKKRRDYTFPEKLRAECDDYYLNNYIQWYNKEPFASMNGQVAQLNIWDDHDIIDGFGSYTDHFMRCDVFRGIGGTAHKYYMLFQHHLPPPSSTYTTNRKGVEDARKADADPMPTRPDPTQLVNTYVAPAKTYPSYIIGAKPGPYVAEQSFNMYARLGARIAFLGIDARTERTRHQVNYPETYGLIFQRLRRELQAAASSDQPIKHLVLLLGIPVAYPRLTWLENVLRSPLIGPIKFFSKRFGVGGGLFNQFDGGVDLLDDLDDHYTARTHKAERLELVKKLQEVSAEFSVRITMLGGDVHLAALGRFYSNPSLKVAAEHDNRYMVNVVSSAIVNKPPPQAVANLLARRNKIHHLDRWTDETLLDLFDRDPGDSAKTANHNHCTMPSRNYATLTENSPLGAVNGANGEATPAVNVGQSSFLGKDGHSRLHSGEIDAGTPHRAAMTETHGSGHDGGIDVRINVEMDQHDPDGKTRGYGLTVPLLDYRKPSRPVTPATTVGTAATSVAETEE